MPTVTYYPTQSFRTNNGGTAYQTYSSSPIAISYDYRAMFRLNVSIPSNAIVSSARFYYAYSSIGRDWDSAALNSMFHSISNWSSATSIRDTKTYIGGATRNSSEPSTDTYYFSDFTSTIQSMLAYPTSTWGVELTRNTSRNDAYTSTMIHGPGNTTGFKPYIVITYTLPDRAPSTPSSLTVPAEIKSGTPYNVSWGASTDPDGTAITYYLQRSINGGSYTAVYSGSLRTYTDTALSSWDTVSYRVRAYSPSLYSSYRTSSTVTVKHAPDMYLNINGVYRECGGVYVNVNGVWRDVEDLFINVNGEWRVS